MLLVSEEMSPARRGMHVQAQLDLSIEWQCAGAQRPWPAHQGSNHARPASQQAPARLLLSVAAARAALVSP